MNSDLQKIADYLKIQLPDLNKAAKESKTEIKEFEKLVQEYLLKINDDKVPDDSNLTDIVLLGSFARGEITRGSDCDYMILQNGAPPKTSRILIEAMEGVRQYRAFKEPGNQGVFGDIVIAANLYESIGLESDTKYEFNSKNVVANRI